MMRQPTSLLALNYLLLPLLAVSGVSADEHEDHAHGEAQEHISELPKMGVAVILPTVGNETAGTLRLMQEGKNLKVVGEIFNLSPGEHGFHIHEFGDLRDLKTGKSVGGHFNPAGVDHGAPGKGHVGDLGNVTADDQGIAQVDATLKNTQLHFVLGRTFVVHAGKDDLQSQPSGDAGPRIGLGLIGIGNPEM